MSGWGGCKAGCPLSLGLGRGGAERVCLRAGAGLDGAPDAANVLFPAPTREGLGSSQGSGAGLFVEPSRKFSLGASRGNCPETRATRLCGWVFPLLRLVSLIHRLSWAGFAE